MKRDPFSAVHGADKRGKKRISTISFQGSPLRSLIAAKEAAKQERKRVSALRWRENNKDTTRALPTPEREVVLLYNYLTIISFILVGPYNRSK